MKLLSIAFRNVGGQNKCSASPELKEREQSEFKQCKWLMFLRTKKKKEIVFNFKTENVFTTL